MPVRNTSAKDLIYLMVMVMVTVILGGDLTWASCYSLGKHGFGQAETRDTLNNEELR